MEETRELKDIIVFGLDGMDRERALGFCKTFGNDVYAFKVHNLYDEHGPSILNDIRRVTDAKLWVDYKAYDIPRTVAERTKALHGNGADIITIHTLGGPKMMEAALESGAEIYGITLLTSTEEEFVMDVFGNTIESVVDVLAKYGKAAGLHGLVCSGLDVRRLSNNPNTNDVPLIVPGTRSMGAAVKDQTRVTTPLSAMQGGAHRLVIASQVSEDPNPFAAFHAIVEEIRPALSVAGGAS